MANTTGKKFGGRKKGTPNKKTDEIRNAFQALVSDKIPELSKWLDEVAQDNPEKALDIIIKFSDFVIPKLQRTELSTQFEISALLQLTPEQRRSQILELKQKLNK